MAIDREHPESADAHAEERAAIAEAMRRGEELRRGVVAGRTHEQVMEAARRALADPR